jgi:hypothetical protein
MMQSIAAESRRRFIKLAGTGIAGIALSGNAPAQTPRREPAEGGDSRLLNIVDFGAIPDAATDNTTAIQRAIDAAAETGATVLVPPGTFLTSTLRMRPHTGLLGYPTWSYREFGGSILRLNDDRAGCLIDITGAFGTSISGLCLDGNETGNDIHGILLDKSDNGKQEDTPLIEGCRIARFSGDAVRLKRVWCFRIRSCMLAFCKGNALYVSGWDGFILDSWLSWNGGAGFIAPKAKLNASITLTGNRIEWNRSGGIVVYGGNNYNITGNNIDRSGGPAIRLGNQSFAFAVTGNMINRSARPEYTSSDELDNAHVHLDNCQGISLVGNAFRAGRDDWGKGTDSPAYGIVYSRLKNSIIKDNTLHNGALKRLLRDLGDNDESVIVKDNTGQLFII